MSGREFDVWLVTGPIEHWRFGVENGVWGATEEIRRTWGKEAPQKGDIFFFYVSAPVGKVVGYGVLEGMGLKKREKRIWEREKREKNVDYRYVLYFSVLRSLVRPKDPIDEWIRKGIVLGECQGQVYRAFTRVKKKECVEELEKCKKLVDAGFVFARKEPNYVLLEDLGVINLLVVPASSSVAVENLGRTVKRLWSVDELLRLFPELDSEVVKKLRNYGKFAIWGATPGENNFSLWERLKERDVVVFYSQGYIVFWGRIIGKVRSAELARKLWPGGTGEETWELIYFVGDVREVRVPMEEFNRVLGYLPSYVPRGHTLVSSDKVSEVIDRVLELLGEHGVGVVVRDVWDVSKVVEKVREVGLEIDSGVVASMVSALEMGKNVILVGPPGTGKTSLAKVLAEALNFDLVVRTATSEWSRTDVVGGPVFIGGEVAWRSGALVEAIAKGFDAESRNKFGVLLLIDEINRANMDRAFGEFFTIFGSSEPGEWELPSSILEEIEAFEDKNLDKYARRLLSLWKSGKFRGRFGGLRLPNNFRVVATMNTYDRRYLFTLGYALLRRFAIIDVPNPGKDRQLDVVKSQLERFDFSEEEIEEAYSLIEDLLKVTERELGIAIIIDTVRHALTVKKHSGGDLSEALDVAIAANIVPQLEGIPLDKLRKVVEKCRDNEFERSAKLIEEYYPEVQYGD